MVIPYTHIQLQPSQRPYQAAALLCLFLALTFASVQHLATKRRQQLELEDQQLSPQSIIGQVPNAHSHAWPTDDNQGIPQGDASSLPVDRTMQQPSEVRHVGFRQEDVQDIFRSVHDLKQKLYGSNADVTIKGQRDLATAAAEVDR